MTKANTFHDPFLKSLSRRKLDEIEFLQSLWNIPKEEFFRLVEKWFANFLDKDKPLALKVLLNIDYYSSADFTRRISELWMPITRFLFETGNNIDDVVLVVPNDPADSADRHAYDVIKKCSLRQLQVMRIDDLKKVEEKSKILVIFNDTHGTGNQIVREMFSKIDRNRFKAVFVIAATISRKALRRFKHEWDDVQVVPDYATPSAYDKFTASELQRIRELGAAVYPSHPLGYGEAGLLTAYYFQCPNNTLPIIWADGSNNTVGGRSCPWVPLFPYSPKKKLTSPLQTPSITKKPETMLLNPADEWEWGGDELLALVAHIASWNLESDLFYKRVGRWFSNFKIQEKAAAYALFLNIQYFGIERIRKGIGWMREQVILDIKKAGGDISDVVLVTTGDEQDSVYHYIFEFVREWRLEVNQVCELGKLTPDKVIDKTLVVFYHTRQAANGFLKSKSEVPSHWDTLRELSPRAIFVAAYGMADEARGALKEAFGTRSNCHTLRLEDASSSLEKRLTDHSRELRAIEDELFRPARDDRRPGELLVAYYFQCPKATNPLIWSERTGGDGGRPWSPLFKHNETPR